MYNSLRNFEKGYEEFPLNFSSVILCVFRHFTICSGEPLFKTDVQCLRTFFRCVEFFCTRSMTGAANTLLALCQGPICKFTHESSWP